MQSVGNARRLLWAAPLLLSGCVGVDVRTDYDSAVDFSRLNTYAWKRLPESGNSLMNGRIVSAVDGQLFARGWRKVAEDQAQTAVAATTTTQKRQRVETFHNNWGPGWQGWGMGGPMMTTSRVVNYTVGTLVVDVYDVRSRNAIWRGTASDIISNDPGRIQRSLGEGVQKMFAAFPPGLAAGSRPN